MVVSKEGLVLTVAHVGQRAGRSVFVIFPDGRRHRAITLGNDRGADAGMVKITDPGPWPSAEIGTSADLKPGQWCLTLGYPITFDLGRPPIVRIGRVLTTWKTEMVTDCTIMGGDSGRTAVQSGREGHWDRHEVRCLARLQPSCADQLFSRGLETVDREQGFR